MQLKLVCDAVEKPGRASKPPRLWRHFPVLYLPSKPQKKIAFLAFQILSLGASMAADSGFARFRSPALRSSLGLSIFTVQPHDLGQILLRAAAAAGGPARPAHSLRQGQSPWRQHPLARAGTVALCPEVNLQAACAPALSFSKAVRPDRNRRGHRSHFLAGPWQPRARRGSYSSRLRFTALSQHSPWTCRGPEAILTIRQRCHRLAAVVLRP